MAQRIFITATNTDVGKTHTTLQLITAYAQMGLRVGVFKPIETGVVTTPHDGKLLFEAALRNNPQLNTLSLEDIVPYQFTLPAAPYVAKAQTAIERSRLTDALHRIEALSDIVLIEGAGGLMVPIEENFFMIDLIAHFNAKALLVTPSRLGAINDTLLSIEALRNRSIAYEWAVNLHEEKKQFETVTRPFYDAYFQTTYLLPHDLEAVAQQLMVE